MNINLVMPWSGKNSINLQISDVNAKLLYLFQCRVYQLFAATWKRWPSTSFSGQVEICGGGTVQQLMLFKMKNTNFSNGILKAAKIVSPANIAHVNKIARFIKHLKTLWTSLEKKPHYEHCREMFRYGLLSLSETNSDELEFKVSPSTSTNELSSTASLDKEQRPKVGQPTSKAISELPNNVDVILREALSSNFELILSCGSCGTEIIVDKLLKDCVQNHRHTCIEGVKVIGDEYSTLFIEPVIKQEPLSDWPSTTF